MGLTSMSIRDRKKPHWLLRAATILIAALTSLSAAILFLVSAFAGFAAWSDYNDRGCPDAVQCSDAIVTMWFTGFTTPLSFLVLIAAAWLTLRMMRRRVA